LHKLYHLSVKRTYLTDSGEIVVDRMWL